jgi:hypothetical protein
VLFLGYMPIISSSLRVLDCTPPIAGVRYLRTNLDVPCGRGEHLAGTVLAYGVLLGLGLGFPALLAWILSTASADAIAQPAFQATWGFLIGGYRTADLEAERIATIAAALAEAQAAGGVEQLVAEAVAASPRTPRGAGAAADASTGGEQVGGASTRGLERRPSSPTGAAANAHRPSRPTGALMAAAATLSRTTPRASLHAGAVKSSWSLLPHGAAASAAGGAPSAAGAGARLRWHDAVIERYCSWRPERLLWWEALVMVRKAGIVLLAVLVTNPYFQCAGAALLLGVSMLLHTQYHPYSEPLFNLLEGIALGAAALTAVVTATLLQYDVDSPEYASQPPAAMTRAQWAVTATLGAVNITTLAWLVAAWLYLQGRAARHHLRVLKLTRRPTLAASKVGRGREADGGGAWQACGDPADGAGPAPDTVNPLYSARPAGARGLPARRRSRVADAGLGGAAAAVAAAAGDCGSAGGDGEGRRGV